jgi:hemerythrin
MCNLETYCHKKHGNLFLLAAEIQALPNFAVVDAFRILVDETEHAFAQEQKIMESSTFPGMQHHLEQHARVLLSLHSAHTKIMQGDYALGRKVGSYLLPEWLKLHATTLDLALDTWIKAQAHPLMNALIGRQTKQEETINLHHAQLQSQLQSKLHNLRSAQHTTP